MSPGSIVEQHEVGVILAVLLWVVVLFFEEILLCYTQTVKDIEENIHRRPRLASLDYVDIVGTHADTDAHITRRYSSRMSKFREPERKGTGTLL